MKDLKIGNFFCVSCFENELIQVSESICRLQMKIIRQFIGVESNSQVQDCTAMSQSVIILYNIKQLIHCIPKTTAAVHFTTLPCEPNTASKHGERFETELRNSNFKTWTETFEKKHASAICAHP